MTEQQNVSFTPSVLVIDDEKRIRDACHKMLTQEGFEVARAENGVLGLEMIQKDHFDIILLDLMMPGLSGFDVLEKVKSLHPDTVIIVITGYATLEHTIEAMKKGAFDFIPKPFSPQDLRLVITKALEHIRTLKDIAHEKSRMRVLINHLGDGVMAADTQNNVALANPTFQKMIGVVGGDFIGRPVSDLVAQPEILKMIDEALAAPADRLSELTAEFSDESRETVLWARCVPFRDRMGRNLGTVTVLHDITVAKKMEQLKSDFVSMVSHEIRSPMNSVLMQLKVILDGLAGPVSEKQTSILTRASERIKALVSLSSELLDLARIESGLITQEREKVDLGPMLADQAEFHRPKAAAKGQVIDLAPLPQLPPIMANRQNMDEVLSNLITNAINYTPEGGRISLGVEAQEKFIRIKVSDNGLGIAREDQEKIFNRFYRVKNEKTRFITGTGLGLPIVKSIVEAHNGKVVLESEVDRGTTFYIYLPVLDS
ncbi:MAG: response regulator [Pseudomonadota bacterium]